MHHLSRISMVVIVMMMVCAMGVVDATAGPTSLDLSGGFNMDAICGPGEFQVCKDNSADLPDLFGSENSGNLYNLVDGGAWMVANGYGPGYSGATLSGNDGLPEDGVLTGDDRSYHVASLFGNGTLPGNWTEVADPSSLANQPNCVVVGAKHNKADWQVAAVTVELPAAQKGAYVDVNFVLAAIDDAHRARNMRIVALYGVDGTDEVVLYSFPTADGGGDGPVMLNPAPAGFGAVNPMGKAYSRHSGTTGAVGDTTSSLFEFDGALALDDTKDLWGFRIEDSAPVLNWAARGLAVLAATATPVAGANTAPTADAGVDQAVVDEDEDNAEDVQLDGSASSDAEGVVMTHVWSEAGSEIATGAMPVVSLGIGSHTILLVVTDADGLTGADVVVVDVEAPAPGLPIADAGPNQTVIDTDDNGSESVALDGSGSYDPDGNIISYEWTEGGSALATGVSPNVVLALGSHTITLTVTDNDSRTRTDTVVITVNAPPSGDPTANAGSDKSYYDLDDSGDELVSLDGSKSSDPDGTIDSYVWTIDTVEIATGETPDVTLAVGGHTIVLTVTDDDTITDTDTVVMTVTAYSLPATYHVNADGGDNANPGTEAEPFATVKYAVDQVKAGDTIIVHDGIYRDMVEFDVSGVEGAPITLRAADGVMPVLSGAGEVTGWTQCTPADAGGNPDAAEIYYADIDWKPKRLYVNNSPMVIARSPWRNPQEGGSGTSLYDPINITEPDGYWTGGTVFIWIRNGTAHYEEEILSHTGSTITFKDLGYGRDPGDNDPYWIGNKVEMIDEPKDWAVRDNGDGTYRVFLWAPGAGGDPTSMLVEGSIKKNWVLGWKKAGHWIIDGFEIRHADGHGLGSWTEGAHHINIRNCSIHHNLGAAIYARYNDYGHYYRNYVGHNAGGGGAGDTTIGITIEESEYDRNTKDGMGITGDDVTIRRNYVHGHWIWSHADNFQSHSDVANLLIEDNLFLAGGQMFMLEYVQGLTMRNNAIIGTENNMIIFSSRGCAGLTLDSNTMMFPGGQSVVTGGDVYDFQDNITFTGKDSGGFQVASEHTHFASDHNLYYNNDLTTDDTLFSALGLYNMNLADFQAQAGVDLNSVYGNPQFVNAPVVRQLVQNLELLKFTANRVYLKSTFGFEVGDHVELDWDGVVRTVTAVEPWYIEFDIPKPELLTFKGFMAVNWKDKTDFTLDLSLQPTSPGIGLAHDGGNVGSDIDVAAFRNSDFDGDGVMDVPRWVDPYAAVPTATQPGDADGDGDVDLDDFVILKQNFGASPLLDDRADFDNDGDVDLDDFVVLKQNFGS